MSQFNINELASLGKQEKQSRNKSADHAGMPEAGEKLEHGRRASSLLSVTPPRLSVMGRAKWVSTPSLSQNHRNRKICASTSHDIW